jgi:hypothetical protein
MLFICHPVVDDKGCPIKWRIEGGDRRYRGVFLGALKDRVRLEHPDAEFEDGDPIPWGSSF